MIIRIVRLTLVKEKVIDFKTIFNDTSAHILTSPGCLVLKLYHDIKEANVIITYSEWNSESDLNNYRNSDLFRNTWAKIKPMFIAAPVAYSMVEISPGSV